MYELVMSVFSILLACIGLSFSIYHFIKSREAENELALKIHENTQLAFLANEIIAHSSNRDSTNEKKFNLLLEELKKAAMNLEEKKRKEIMPPLEQKSKSARLNYILKLANLSKIVGATAAMGERTTAIATSKGKQKTA